MFCEFGMILFMKLEKMLFVFWMIDLLVLEFIFNLELLLLFSGVFLLLIVFIFLFK